MPISASTSPSPHYATIEKNIPAWLRQSTPEARAGLRNWRQGPDWLTAAVRQQPDIAKAWQAEHARHRQHQASVRGLFAQLPDLQTYARELLTDAIKQRFGLDLDVDETYLVDARLIDTRSATDGRQAVDRATRSLLHCALHNFDASAAQENGMDAPDALLKKSVILDHRRFMGTVPITNALGITAEAFAECCRTLDIGGKYHNLVHAIYYPAASPEASADEAALRVYETLGRAEVSAFRQSLHFARLKGDISEALYTAALATPLDQAPSTAAPVTFSKLSLWEAELTGIVFIALKAAGRSSVALYNPQDNTLPLKEFSTWEALQAQLSDRLRNDIHYLDPHIGERDKTSVTSRLRDRLTPMGWSIRGLHEPVSDPHATLYPVPRSFTHAFQGVMAFAKAQRHERDVLYHATPTEIVDRRSAQAHRELIASRLLTALNVAGFFVPALGEVMLAVCVSQLAYEVYEGIEAWENDERDIAYDYLVDVIENVAIMAALSAAAKVLKGSGGDTTVPLQDAEVDEPDIQRIPVETPSFIEELDDIDMPDGQVRLWKPDLGPYRRLQALPESLQPDESGLRHYQGQQWLVTDGDRYVIETDANGHYRLQHPQGPRRYQPPVRHNGAGAWLHVTDQPATWSGTALLRRIGHLNAHFDESTLQRIIAISGTREDVLRLAVVENQRLPALLEDTLQRFRLARDIQQLSDSSLWAAEFEGAYARLPNTQAAGASTLQRIYRQLPVPIVDELVRSASVNERQMLESSRMPLRLAEEIRVYQQQVRLARAYEGLYLDCVRSWDSDVLTIHTLQQLPHWPADIRLELRQQRFWPSQRASIGPADAGSHVTILSAEAGYIVQLAQASDGSLKALPNLPAALVEALPHAMARLAVSDEAGLRQQLRQTPLLPATVLREALGMRPIRPGYRSPMRLADGRVGYPLSGDQAAGPSRQNLLDAVNATGIAQHTRRSAQQILMMITSPGRTQPQVLAHLQALQEQRLELESRLDEWYEGISPVSEQAAAQHDNLRNSIMQHWYDSALDEHNRYPSQLSLSGVALADIPLNLPERFTSRIRRLRLHDLASTGMAGWMQHERLLQRLLRQLPELQELEITRPYNPLATPSAFLFSLPTISSLLPHLRELVITHQNIVLTATDLDMLVGMPELRHLDLSGNRFSPTNSPSLHEFNLDFLGLNDMQLSQWPIGLGSDALGRIAHVSLRNNELRSLPTFLLNDPDRALSHSVLSMEGNPINESHLERLFLNETAQNSHVNVDRPVALTERLERIRHERQQLHEAIDGWVQASSSSAPLTQAILEDRLRIAAAIRQFWENQERGMHHLRLQLADVSLNNFPRRLPAFFNGHVTALTLTGVSGSTRELNDLLRRFPNITRLTIDAHVDASPTLVSALTDLRRLNYLEFRNMGVEIDQRMLETFEQLEHLTSLDLSGNRHGVITRVPPLLARRLNSLSLSNTGLQAWPEWCTRLLPLELLDLSNNNISQLPDFVMENMENPLLFASIALFDNPLSIDTILRLRAYSESQHSWSFGLDADNLVLGTDSSDTSSQLDHPHFPLIGDDTPRAELWALGNEAQNEALHDCWNRLQKMDDGNNLLRLVGRLSNAAPYVDPTSQAAFCERVRMMLVIAATDDEMRPTMSVIAAEGLPDPVTGAQTCHDGALQAFNNVELYVMSNRVLLEAGDTQRELFQRLRQLFRMEQLEQLANRRTAEGDHVSVRLAYRRELASLLDLPIADSMRFRSAARLAAGELDEVMEQIRARESGGELMQYLMSNPYWTDRLRGEHADRFASIVQRFGERVQALSQRDLPLTEELEQQQMLQNHKNQEELELLQELTRPYLD
ncbi:dermonecrotic toxin domain-containing protein [Pseudomonas sp. NPDC089996]|uniref:dermonecrotic toxin domain-containing protein n=1 Tax=Pseudomonas sp. NPDC089996 TaxID=3364474 RepID=UPI00380ED9C5